MSQQNRFRIPTLYKKFLLLAIVIGPIYWLMFTEDGRRRTDIVFLTLAGDPSVELRLDILASGASEEDFREFLPDIAWKCENQRTDFGERNCVSPIAAFNDAPAHYLVLYFDTSRLNAMKVVYRRGYHDWLVRQLRQMLGEPVSSDEGILQWTTDKGLILMPRRLLPEGDDPTMLWLSAELAADRMPGHRE
jgi:hypothetical protein